MLKKCTPLWREARCQVKMEKAHHLRTTFGRSSVFSWQATTKTTTRLNCTALHDTYSCSYRVQLQLHHATTPHKYNYNNNRTARQDYNTGTLRRYALQHYNITNTTPQHYNYITLQLHYNNYTTPHHTTPTSATTTTLRYTRLKLH